MISDFFRKTFSSLKVRNYRLYYFGQIVSLSGTFLQTLAQDWLVLKLTNSGTMVGLTLAFQFLPMLVLMPWGGVIADRLKKINVLWLTQSIAGILSLVLGIFVLIGMIHVWMVFLFAFLLGLNNSVDFPTRQSFVFEMVGKDEIRNAVSIWTVLVSVTRIIGPALAGILIATAGIGQCFVINALSYIAVLAAFFFIRQDQLHMTKPEKISSGQIMHQIKQGFSYVKATPILFITLAQLAIIGTITFEWQASMPLFARFTLHGDATTYSIITIAMSVGLLIGGLFTARRNSVSEKWMVYSGIALGIVTIATSFATTLPLAVIAFGLWGIAVIFVANISNIICQVHTDPQMRGRIMSFWNMAFSASTAIGGPLIGWIGQVWGAQWSLAVGGIAALVAAAYGWIAAKKAKLM